MPNLKPVLVFAVAALMLGCAHDQEFGSSNRHMIRAQSYDPSAPHPTSEAPKLDGAKTEAALKVYREGSNSVLSAPAAGSLSTGP